MHLLFKIISIDCVKIVLKAYIWRGYFAKAMIGATLKREFLLTNCEDSSSNLTTKSVFT